MGAERTRMKLKQDGLTPWSSKQHKPYKPYRHRACKGVGAIIDEETELPLSVYEDTSGNHHPNRKSKCQGHPLAFLHVHSEASKNVRKSRTDDLWISPYVTTQLSWPRMPPS